MTSDTDDPDPPESCRQLQPFAVRIEPKLQRYQLIQSPFNGSRCRFLQRGVVNIKQMLWKQFEDEQDFLCLEPSLSVLPASL